MEDVQDVLPDPSNNKVNLKLQLQEFQQILKERDILLEEVEELKEHIKELNENNEKLKEEHAEELAVLSSSFSLHFQEQDDTNNNEEEIKEYQREIQKLKNSIEDKNYHINQLQRKLMKTQVEMEDDLEKHETELENLRSQLEKLQNSDTESLIEERMNELKEVYEKEISELKARLEAEESVHNDSQVKDEQLTNTMKEVHELKTKLESLEDSMDERLEEEESKFRREVMSVKDKLIHQHQLEIDELLAQLERSNAEVEKLRRLSRQSDIAEDLSHIHPLSNGDIENVNGLQDENGDGRHFELVPVQIEVTEPKFVQELENIHTHYKQQFDFLNKKIKEQYQQDLDENVQKIEEDHEHQLEKQRSEYEEKITGIQRQLRAHFQTDLDRVTNDMEEQFQVLKDGHAEEITDLTQRLRGLSDERRRSYIEQDNNQQHVIVIKEEFKSRVENFEQELRNEKEKVAEYEAKLQGVDIQIVAFKAEKEQEVKYIEEELKKQCKVLVEKKTKEVKERYQSELNEKVNKVEKTLRKQYDEESVRTRCEREESHRTLKEKYDTELSDIMTQMEQVQQRHQEVFEAEQKEHFEKQLSIVKEQLEPYKDKCDDLEKENRQLLEKYNKDLSELKLKMDEVDKRYSENERIEEESLRTLEDELNLYKTKVKQLEEGNKMLVMNYGAQLENVKRKYKESEEGELRTLQEEVSIYTKKVEKLHQENTLLTENYDNQIKYLNENIEELTNELNVKEKDVEKVCSDKDTLNKTIEELSKQLKWYMNNCSELEDNKKALDNRHAEEIEKFQDKIRLLDKDLEYYRQHFSELENSIKTVSEGNNEKDNKIRSLESELQETRNNFLKFQEEKSNLDKNNPEEVETLKRKLQALEQKGLERDDSKVEIIQMKMQTKEMQTLTDKITELEKCVHDCHQSYNQLEELKRSMESKHIDEKQELCSRIEKQMVVVEECERNLENVKNEKVKLEGDLRKLTEELGSSSQKFQNFKTEKEAVIEEKNNVINELSGKINKMQEIKDGGDKVESKKLQEENESLKNETKRLKMFLESLRAENNQLLNETQIAADKHKKQVKQINEELMSLRAENTKQSKELDKVKERYELLIVDLKDEIETQKGTLSELELTNNQYVQEIATLLEEMERVQNNKPNNSSIDNSNSSEENSFNKDESNNLSPSMDEDTRRLLYEIDELKAQNEQFKVLVEELEEEGDNKFGVLLSQHEKELEILKEELEEQISRKREQLAQEAATKRQKLKEEYESKLRVIYEELVAERTRSKDQMQQINQLSQKVKLLEGINSKQKKDIERVKQMEEKVKELERQTKKRENDAEREDDVKTNIKILEDKLLELSEKLVQTENAFNEKVQELTKATEKVKSLEEQLDSKNQENDSPRKEPQNAVDNREVVVSAASEVLQSGNNGFMNSAFEGTKAKLDERIQELESENAVKNKQIQEVTLRNEKLQKDLQNMDKAKQVVIQIYDEKMEALAIELDDSSERCDVLRRQFEQGKKMLRRKGKELEDKQNQFVTLESELKTEKETGVTLRQKVDELEEQLEIQRGTANGNRIEDDVHHEELRQKITTLEADLHNEKDRNSKLTHKIEEQTVEMNDVVTNKDKIIAEREDNISHVEEELNLEKKKSADLEKELAIFKDDTIFQKAEKLKNDLDKVHERNNQLLKQNYESILSQKEEENRVRTEEFENEIVTLKGMIDNLEQLCQLKDEDREIQLKECEEKHDNAMLGCQEAFGNERKELNQKFLEVTNESHFRKTKVEELSLQVRTLSEEQETQKKSYENEINTLRNQLDFENSFQVELQDGFQNELKTTVEEQNREHKKDLERVNAELQLKMDELKETRSEQEVVLKELEVSKQNLESRTLVIKSLEDRIIEYKAKHEEEVVELTKRIENLSNNADVIASTTNDNLITSLRDENKRLEEEVQRLNDLDEEKHSEHQVDIELVKSELEKRFQERHNEMNKRHSQELDDLMMRLETLVRQETDSKALTKSHMEEINSVRNEMVQRAAELASEKDQEVEATRRRIEDHYGTRQKELQDQLNAKCNENVELQKAIRVMTARADQEQSTTEELFQLRRENTELYRKLREQAADGAQEMVEILREENRNLNRENENLKRMLRRNSNAGTSESSSESLRLLQLMKVMEQLMTEKNRLEKKLREEILDLKTRFGPYGDISNSSSNLSNLSLSPEKVSREGLVNMLQDLRASKNQQEEDIQVHIREIERMIEDIKSKIKSTEYADTKIQDMLTKQLHHLEEQRRLLVNRLWKLREKHDMVEQKLAQQIAALGSPASPGDVIKSKLYQNLLEENLRKEKEQLLSKQQQVNDLRKRLSLEKATMDRKVAERQRLQQQLSEKDRQESELSTERYELERKWRDRMRMREIELKQDEIDLQRRGATNYRDSVASRISGLISRSSDDLSVERQRYVYPETSNQPLLNRYYLQREARTSTNRVESVTNLTEFTHFKPYEVERSGPSSQYYTRGLSSRRDLGFKQLPNEVPGSVFRNDHEHTSDDDLEFAMGLSNHGDAVSVDMDDKFDSDIDSYTPPSGDRLAGMEKSWERNLEEELKKISAGTLRILPSGKVNSTRDNALESRRITRTQSDLGSRDYVPRSYQTPLETASPSTFERPRQEDRYPPRSSTAIPGDEHEWLNRNGSMNMSEISTVLPTLLKDITKRRETKKYDHSSSPIEYRDPSTRGDQRPGFAYNKHSSPKDQAVNSTSPNSSKSEPITRTDLRNKKPLSMDRGASNSQADLRSSMYLLNMDDYIDRHKVLSSNVVASLRDLSPSEKYSYS